ncbi:MAG: asparagine synthetase B, partial [Chitinophagaceae bacterium]|nr:asparagine synthetase B [Anaerolineae bacterium]
PKKGFAPPIFEWYSALLKAHGANLVDGYLVQKGILTPEAAASLAQGEGLRNGVITLPFKALTLEMWARKML